MTTNQDTGKYMCLCSASLIRKKCSHPKHCHSIPFFFSWLVPTYSCRSTTFRYSSIASRSSIPLLTVDDIHFLLQLRRSCNMLVVSLQPLLVDHYSLLSSSHVCDHQTNQCLALILYLSHQFQGPGLNLAIKAKVFTGTKSSTDYSKVQGGEYLLFFSLQQNAELGISVLVSF